VTTLACLQPENFVSRGDDCDDDNANINPETIWVKDSNGNGLANEGEETLTQCSQPAGYTLSTGVAASDAPTLGEWGIVLLVGLVLVGFYRKERINLS